MKELAKRGPKPAIFKEFVTYKSEKAACHQKGKAPTPTDLIPPAGRA